MKDEDDMEDRKVSSFREYLGTAKDTLKVLRWVLKVAVTSQSKWHLRLMFVWIGLSAVLAALQPWSMNYVFTGLAKHDKRMVIWGIALFITFLGTLKALDRLYEIAREWVICLHGRRLDDHVNDLFFEKSIGQHTQEGTRLSASNINKGKYRIVDIQMILLFDGISILVQIVISAVCLLILSVMGGLIMLSLIAIYIVWGLYLNYRVALECTPIEKDWRKLNKRRDERWEKVERVIVNGHERLEASEMSQMYDDVSVRDAKFWVWFIGNANIRSFVNLLCLGACSSWGIWLVWNGEWKIGLLFPLLAWSNRISENVWRFGEIERRINWNMPSAKLMIEALEIPPAIVDRPNASTLDHSKPHRIEFRDVSHTYPAEMDDGTEPPAALVRASFTVEKGEKVAIIGPSGAGKSTLLKALLRFEDPTGGSIAVGGADLRDIAISSYRKGIGYIPQRDQVFDGTIRSNLIYGLGSEEREAVTDEDLWTLMELLQIDFGKRLTQGLDTVVGKSGLKLSGGQAQRLMIGAAVVKKPWLLIVDEATASLDSTTEKLVQEGLAKALSGNTSAVIVAHRLSTVRRLCTKFVVLRPADEVKDGESQVEAVASSFEELYEISPTFKRLADDQGVIVERMLGVSA